MRDALPAELKVELGRLEPRELAPGEEEEEEAAAAATAADDDRAREGGGEDARGAGGRGAERTSRQEKPPQRSGPDAIDDYRQAMEASKPDR